MTNKTVADGGPTPGVTPANSQTSMRFRASRIGSTTLAPVQGGPPTATRPCNLPLPWQ